MSSSVSTWSNVDRCRRGRDQWWGTKEDHLSPLRQALEQEYFPKIVNIQVFQFVTYFIPYLPKVNTESPSKVVKSTEISNNYFLQQVEHRHEGNNKGKQFHHLFFWYHGDSFEINNKESFENPVEGHHGEKGSCPKPDKIVSKNNNRKSERSPQHS